MHLEHQFIQLEQIVRTAFQSFDKDCSGFIDKSELKEVARELGKELDEVEIQECLLDLDSNKDGKISYDEFKRWWLSGRQNQSPWMRNMLAYKLTNTKLLETFQNSFGEVIRSSTSFEDKEMVTDSFTVNINRPEHVGTHIHAKLHLLSKEVRAHYQRLKVLHSY